MTQSNRNQQHSLKTLSFGLILVLVTQLLSACIPVLVGTATVTAINLYTDRRPIQQNVDDNALEFQLRAEYQTDEKLSAVNISIIALNGIVLLTGEVFNDEQRQYAEEVALSFENTREVVNEIQLSGTTNLNSRANDSYITGKVKSKLATAKDVPVSNIKVLTERGTVYLLGLVSHPEAEEAVKVTQSVNGVTHIVKVFQYIDN